MKTQLLRPSHKLRWLQAFLLFLLALALLLPRLLQLSHYVTVDEPLWLIRSANFYHALAAGDWKDTFQREHPGVTIMWAGTLGFLLRFPDYARLADAQVVNPEVLDEFLGQHQHTSLGLLVAGRLVAVLGVTLAVLLALPFLARLVGWLPATLAIFLVALDPYFIALSRLLHLDGPVAAWMLLSLLSFMSYLYQGRRRLDLLVSAVSAGLAWLTKSPALFLIPFCGLLVLLQLLGQWRQSDWTQLREWRAALANAWQAAGPYLLWLLLGSAVFVLLWPAMWVDPLNSLARIFSQATTYAAEGQDSATFFMGAVYQAGQSPWFFYPVSLLWRLTPLVTIGLLLALLALLFPRRASLSPDYKKTILVLSLFTILFVVLITLSQKKADRYQIPVQPALCILAALGWVTWLRALLRQARTRFRSSRLNNLMQNSGIWLAIGSGLLVLWQLLGPLQTFPYYDYYNDLLGGSQAATSVMMIGRGEGLDQAARYLNSLPNASKLVAMARYNKGCVSYYFNGRVLGMEDDASLDDLKKADFVIMYIHQWQRQIPSKEALDYLKTLKPVFVARIGGLDYAEVYDMKDAH
jgi:Dolichyl-phosphate-mannose-protein mannosyltransferase